MFRFSALVCLIFDFSVLAKNFRFGPSLVFMNVMLLIFSKLSNRFPLSELLPTEGNGSNSFTKKSVTFPDVPPTKKLKAGIFSFTSVFLPFLALLQLQLRRFQVLERLQPQLRQN